MSRDSKTYQNYDMQNVRDTEEDYYEEYDLYYFDPALLNGMSSVMSGGSIYYKERG